MLHMKINNSAMIGQQVVSKWWYNMVMQVVKNHQWKSEKKIRLNLVAWNIAGLPNYIQCPYRTDINKSANFGTSRKECHFSKQRSLFGEEFESLLTLLSLL